MTETKLLEYLPDDLYDGAVVFITGGGSGINLGIARAFALLGADVAICGRSADRLDAAAAELEELGAQVVAVPADVRDYDALVHAVEVTRDELGPISVLVCGAAGNFPCRAEQLSANGFKAVVDIDLLGTFNASFRPARRLRRIRRRRTSGPQRRGSISSCAISRWSGAGTASGSTRSPPGPSKAPRACAGWVPTTRNTTIG